MNQLYVEPVIYLLAAVILFRVYRFAGRASIEEDAHVAEKKKKVKKMTFFGAIACAIFFIIKVVTIASM
ncbi:MAG: hypothetical protein KAS88_05265 [Deltaproteobacteria bacterium]|nr:hypothetical protein [Deltaproteobacteria bacterium]